MNSTLMHDNNVSTFSHTIVPDGREYNIMTPPSFGPQFIKNGESK